MLFFMGIGPCCAVTTFDLFAQFTNSFLPSFIYQEIVEFTKTIDPDMPEKLDFFEKADVNGANTREVFSFLKEKLPSEDGTTGIRWNFSKYLSLCYCMCSP